MVLNKLYDFKKILYSISLFSSLIFTGYSLADVNSNTRVSTKSGLERKILANFTGQDLHERDDIRKYLGLPEELFDSKKENNEITKKGVQLVKVNEKSFMTVNYTDSSSENKSFSFNINEERFKDMIGYIALIDQNARNNAEKTARNWTNKGQIGLTTEGLRLLVEHEHIINKQLRAYANLDIAQDRRTVELGIKERDKNKEKKQGIFYSSGEDIKDNNFEELGIKAIKIDYGRKSSEIYQASFLDLGNDSGLRGKYGYLTTDIKGFVSGFKVGFNESTNDDFTGSIYLALIDNEYYKDDALFTATKQIEKYDSRKKIGNHPLLSKGIGTQVSLGYENDHTNAELLQKFNNWLGVFIGTGTIWHDYNPHIGAIFQGKKLGISFSVSDSNFLLDLIPPKLETTKYKDIYD